MPTAAADHNLLVGVLALQLDFVARDELLDAACHVLSGEKSEPLIDLLRARGVLKQDECDLLAALVSRHLSRHNNDPQESLAHCDGAGQIRQLLTAVGGPPGGKANPAVDSSSDLSAAETLGHGAKIDPYATRVGDPFVTTPPGRKAAHRSDVTLVPSNEPTMAYTQFAVLQAAGAAPPSSVARGSGPAGAGPLSTPPAARYRILRPFQRGGLGQVSLAQDEELNREVALKEILPKHADSDEARQRFLMEAEITGSLEHPGVVPVYGLGQYGDGRPFYAMRLIRGDNLQLAIEEYHRRPDAADHELHFRQLLGRFVDVCNAIEYAHNRCVLHRDLKPGNIMLGKYGETLVVDWGLAKAMGAGGSSAESVEVPVRPASADHSTETQMGRIVGTPAYMSPEQAMGRVDMLGPATDIYSLGATLYHLLVGRAPFGADDRNALLDNVQMGKFTPPRGHKRDISKRLEAICLKAMARVPTNRYVSARAMADDVERYLADEPVDAFPESIAHRAARWMRKHRAAVMGAGGVLAVLAASLGIGLVFVNAANQRAEHNFEIARTAIRDYYITVSEETLLDQPGLQPLREQLLRQALDYYKQFLASEQRDDAMLDELAQANFFVGRITETIESPAEAVAYYETAVTLNDRLVAQKPDDEQRLFAQARTLNALGGTLQKLKRLDEADRFYSQAESVRQKLVDEHPDNAEYVRTLANTVMNRGIVQAATRGQEKNGAARFERAQELRKDRLAAGVENTKLRADAGMGDFNLGLQHYNAGDAPAAEKHLRDAVASFELVRKADPDDLASQFQLAQSYSTLGDLKADAGETDEAQTSYAKAVELLTTLTLRSPQVADYKITLARVQISVADLSMATYQGDAAQAAIEKALPPLEELVAEYPDDPAFTRDLAVALRLHADALKLLDKANLARPDAQRALDLLAELVAADPANDDFQAQLEAAQVLLESLSSP